MQKFNRVFDRYDVRISRLINVIDHRRERRRFSRTRRSGNENQAALLVRDARQNRRQSEFGKIANMVGDDARDDAD